MRFLPRLVAHGQNDRIIRYCYDTDVSRRSEWEGGFRWLKGQAEQFRRFFSPRIKSLPISDFEAIPDEIGLVEE
jgi:hypothetical protein